MLNEDHAAWFNAHWSQNMGAIDGRDVGFLAAMIARQQPERVVEIGCASGLSTALMAQMLGPQGQAQIDSFDLTKKFYADPSKSVGYLLEDLPPPAGVTVKLHVGTTSIDVAEHVPGSVGLCFIDAAHKHPWPLIDTLAILPLMAPGGVIVHHDLEMYGGKNSYALGPKVLFDQLTEAERLLPSDVTDFEAVAALKQRHIKENIYGIAVPSDRAAFAERIAAGFYVGWDRDKTKRVPDAFAARFSAMLKKNYPPAVARAFAIGMQRYNPGAQAVHLSAPRRIIQRLRGR